MWTDHWVSSKIDLAAKGFFKFQSKCKKRVSNGFAELNQQIDIAIFVSFTSRKRTEQCAG